MENMQHNIKITDELTTVDTASSVYRNFSQVKASIKGVEAIDYFFAKEMTEALITHKALVLPLESFQNLYHVFLALSVSLRAGHSCLSLAEIAGLHWGKGYPVQNHVVKAEQEHSYQENIPLSHAGFVFSSLAQIQELLAELKIKPIDKQLLVVDNDKLYLRRYYQFECNLSHGINSRLSQACTFNQEQIEQCISSLFPEEQVENNAEIDWQKVAVANAINKNFSVIAGGPGTGKTYTVTKLLAALVMLEHAKTSNADSNKSINTETALNIALVAPTGKAAQRLSESIVDAINGFKALIAADVLEKIPTQAQTIHRLLGVIPNSPNFRHHENNRLAYDVVLIDEVSMVDLPLMTRIFRALKDSAKVILLGDADQLPSVAAGSVLADIAPRPHRGYSVQNKDYLAQVCQLSKEQVGSLLSTLSSPTADETANTIERKDHYLDYLSFLVKSRRFDGKGGIGLIAHEVINGKAKQSWHRLIESNQQENGQLSMAEGDLSAWLQPLVKTYYQPITACHDVSEAFALLSQFRVLCATRQGDYGVERMNELIKGYLGKGSSPFQQGLHNRQQHSLYHGQPIMINENDYRLGLYNGDIGIIWEIKDAEGNAHLMACFESEVKGQEVRQILPSRLPKFESVYAMTIHKTQGSEFAHVAMVLSASDTDLNAGQQTASKLLTRELLYTGITRAKKQLTLCANQSVWQQGVIGQVKRNSGLQLN